jgi:transcription antitermination factor NusG
MGCSWHVVITQPNRETVAASELLRTGHQVFDPREHVTLLRRGRLINALRRYIPGYLFVNFDAIGDEWVRINHLEGIRRVICNPPDRPVPVPAGAISAMRELGEPGVIAVNDNVRLVHGPFVGRVGIVQRLLKHQLLINSGGRKLCVPTQACVLHRC